MPTLENGGISEDGLTITMNLRDGLKWSDGEPRTSEDFRVTWAMTADPKNTVASTYPYDLITNVETQDPQTVVMKFDESFAPWQPCGTASFRHIFDHRLVVLGKEQGVENA